jgi:hypothetical protein
MLRAIAEQIGDHAVVKNRHAGFLPRHVNGNLSSHAYSLEIEGSGARDKADEGCARSAGTMLGAIGRPS